jgi:NmrA-like family
LAVLAAAIYLGLYPNATIVAELAPRILQPAVAAGVRRFVPDEFGVHTKGLAYRVGTLFDAKKTFQETLWTSGLEWTLIFTGGIFDYFFRIFGSLSA